jgi:hypothetical protein
LTCQKWSSTILRGVPELLTARAGLGRIKGTALAQRGGPRPFPGRRWFQPKTACLALVCPPHVRNCLVPAANLGWRPFPWRRLRTTIWESTNCWRFVWPRTCGHAPDRLRGNGSSCRQIANRWPMSPKPPREYLRGDLATFIEVYGMAPLYRARPFLPMLEAGIGLGMVNLLFSTTVCLSEWERSGGIPIGSKADALVGGLFARVGHRSCATPRKPR